MKKIFAKKPWNFLSKLALQSLGCMPSYLSCSWASQKKRKDDSVAKLWTEMQLCSWSNLVLSDVRRLQLKGTVLFENHRAQTKSLHSCFLNLGLTLNFPKGYLNMVLLPSWKGKSFCRRLAGSMHHFPSHAAYTFDPLSPLLFGNFLFFSAFQALLQS